MINSINNYLANGAPVVALHSSASNGRQWQQLIADLECKQDVFALDLPGYGSDLTRDDLKTGMSRVAMPMLKIIEQFDEPVHLVGHSFGGGVALKIALNRPDLIKSLTVYEPVAFHLLAGNTTADDELLADLKSLAETLNTQNSIGRPDLGMMPFINFWNGKSTWDQMPDPLCNKLAGLACSVAADFEDAFEETWSLEELNNLNIPTQILMGMDSPAIAQRLATLVFEGIKGAELVMLPGLGHMAPVSAPDWVNPRISQHIARVERSAGHCSWPRQQAA